MKYITIDTDGVHETNTNPLIAELRRFFPDKTDEEVVAAALALYYADPTAKARPGRADEQTIDAALVRLRMQHDAAFREGVEMQEEYARAHGLLRRHAND